MDPITQAALGATVGQVGFQKRLGRRALLWGAIIGMLPDLDMVVKIFSDPLAMMKYHRGFTHSILVGPIIGLIVGYCIWWLLDRSKQENTKLAWLGLGIWAIVTHPLLDYFTIYGTQLLAPFCDYRFYVPGVCVVDPIYTIILFIAIVLGAIFHKSARVYISSAVIALTLSSGYLFYGIVINTEAEKIAKLQLSDSEQEYKCLKSYTTLLQPFLRRIVVHTVDEVLIGFVSTWNPKTIDWDRFPKAKIPAVRQLKEHDMGKTFAWFSDYDNLFIMKEINGQQYIEMHDLRYGTPKQNVTGIWRLRAKINAKGLLISEPVKVRVSNKINNGFFRKMFVGAYG